MLFYLKRNNIIDNVIASVRIRLSINSLVEFPITIGKGPIKIIVEYSTFETGEEITKSTDPKIIKITPKNIRNKPMLGSSIMRENFLFNLLEVFRQFFWGQSFF